MCFVFSPVACGALTAFLKGKSGRGRDIQFLIILLEDGTVNIVWC